MGRAKDEVEGLLATSLLQDEQIKSLKEQNSRLVAALKLALLPGAVEQRAILDQESAWLDGWQKAQKSHLEPFRLYPMPWRASNDNWSEL